MDRCKCSYVKNKKLIIDENGCHFLFFECNNCNKILNVRFDDLTPINIKNEEFNKLFDIHSYNKRNEMLCNYYTIKYYLDKTEIIIKDKLPNDEISKDKLMESLLPYLDMFKVFIIYRNTIYDDKKLLSNLIFDDDDDDDDDDEKPSCIGIKKYVK